MSKNSGRPFSFRERSVAIERFRHEEFDLLVVGGGITGAATARDAVSRGLKVALVEKNDFASGTSSKSSKLIHGGLRYLENKEFNLVFEALSERALLLKKVPHMVKPLKFFLPTYAGDPHGRGILSLGLWLYDLLALFRAPGFHRRLSSSQMLKLIPHLRSEGLTGGFSYFDASMWDDLLAIETLRDAVQRGAAVANYVEALEPLWSQDRIVGFKVLEKFPRALSYSESALAPFELRAKKVIVCAGPWTDALGSKLSKDWKPWLQPSKGVHLIFDSKRLPVPGAMVMAHPSDGRISFVIPREDFGTGVVIVGTTDGPSPSNPEQVGIASADVAYLLELLNRYFPSLNIQGSDILSAYVGIRPLFGGPAVGEGQALQSVSREHHIAVGPGQSVVVAGGKYTTHRKMAEEIVDFALKNWGSAEPLPTLKPSATHDALNPATTLEAISAAIEKWGSDIPHKIIQRYGQEYALVGELEAQLQPNDVPWPEGFTQVGAELRFAIRFGMVIHLEDFFFRRSALFASRRDHGWPWAVALARIWVEEMGEDPGSVRGAELARVELDRLERAIQMSEAWRTLATPEINKPHGTEHEAAR